MSSRSESFHLLYSFWVTYLSFCTHRCSKDCTILVQYTVKWSGKKKKYDIALGRFFQTAGDHELVKKVLIATTLLNDNIYNSICSIRSVPIRYKYKLVIMVDATSGDGDRVGHNHHVLSPRSLIIYQLCPRLQKMSNIIQ